MTVTLELSADEARVLQEIACAAGVRVETVLHGLIAQAVPPGRDAPPADPEVLAEQKREQEEVEANIRRWHEERAASLPGSGSLGSGSLGSG